MPIAEQLLGRPVVQPVPGSEVIISMHHPVYSLVIIYRKYTGACENDFIAGG